MRPPPARSPTASPQDPRRSLRLPCDNRRHATRSTVRRSTMVQTAHDDSAHELTLHVLAFARTLRTSGLRVGPGQVLDAIEAVRCAGVARREDFQAALAVALVRSPAERRLFEQAFHVHFRNPRLLERLLALLLPRLHAKLTDDAQRLQRRLAEALFAEGGAADMARDTSTEHDAFLTASELEVLQRKDFAGMSAEELAQAKRMLRQAAMPF